MQQYVSGGEKEYIHSHVRKHTHTYTRTHTNTHTHTRTHSLTNKHTLTCSGAALVVLMLACSQPILASTGAVPEMLAAAGGMCFFALHICMSIRTNLSAHVYVYIYIYMYMCV